ncbi:probable caffeine synthase MTL2 [Ziziphus jujuba]|nr:probable caffeine synthase MTL2 [Ziziphus jujuba]
MEVERVLHMKGGIGETSYASNSSLQRLVITKVKPILEESVIGVYYSVTPECLRIADLGCSSGPNTLLVASEIMDIIDAASQCLNNHQAPAFQVFLNDLPGNDFNTIFESLPSFYKRLEKEKGSKFGPCFISGMPGSFYGRLFPRNFLHFIHSSYSLHFLSQPPKGLRTEEGEALNKGNIYIAKTSPPEVFKAYFNQFEKDFTLFLRSRSEEIVPGGGMLLTTMGSIQSDDPRNIWEVVGTTLHDMVLEGLIEKENLDYFDLPYYAPTSKEVEMVIEAEGSFSLHGLKIFEMDWDANLKEENDNSVIAIDEKTRGQFVSNYMRAVAEPILSKQFGEAIIDGFFKRFTDKVIHLMAKEKCQYVNLVISLTRKRV